MATALLQDLGNWTEPAADRQADGVRRVPCLGLALGAGLLGWLAIGSILGAILA